MNAQGHQQEELSGGGPGAALAALAGALAGLGRSVPDLMAEYAFRIHWLDLPPARIRELAAEKQLEYGKRRYRGALIDALDDEVRAMHAARAATEPSAPPTPDDDIDMDALFRAAPLDGLRRRP